MSQVPNPPPVATSDQAPQTLVLGLYVDVRLVGVYPDEERGAGFMVRFQNGWRTPTGVKVRVSRRIPAVDKVVADCLAHTILLELQAAWEVCAAKIGRVKETPAAPAPQPAAGIMEQRANVVLARWKTETKRKQTLAGYANDLRAFIRLSGPLAKGQPENYTPENCEPIRDARLGELDPATNGPKQSMRNLRFALQEIPGFPDNCIEVFRAPRKKRGQTQKEDFGFSPADREAMFDGLREATWLQRLLYYLGANGAMHLADAVTSLTEDLKEARNALSNRKRVKNGNRFKFSPWPELLECFDQREKPEAVYLFWMFIFTAKELKANPDIILTELTEEELKHRLLKVTAKARTCFDKFLEKVGIARTGISFRSFRHTNISAWEERGVPRTLGMSVTGQTEEKNYAGYVHSSVPQLVSLAELTRDVYHPATMNKPCYLTQTQAVEEIKKDRQESEARAMAAIDSLQKQFVERPRVDNARLFQLLTGVDVHALGDCRITVQISIVPNSAPATQPDKLLETATALPLPRLALPGVAAAAEPSIPATIESNPTERKTL